ncbi:MAG: hypothetical protein M0Q90_06050 [Bacteroidales bacterium]|nr:hypothetical protein [Bacteroidales bacterium]
MKNTFFKLFALVILAGLLLHGCQKEPQSGDSSGQSHEMVYTPKAASLVADINNFKQKMTAVRENPHLKSGEVISKEDARWNLETLFNATYGFPDLAYRKTLTDTALLYLPVDASGNALLEDVVAVYDEILSLITGFYIEANFDEKGFLFMQLSSGDVANGELEIRLEAVTGARLGTPNDPPFISEYFFEGWKFGMNLGDCDATIDDSDAADQLEMAIRSSMYAWPEPPNGFRWMTANSFTIELTGFEYIEGDDYLLFYIEKPQGEEFTTDDICLDVDEMNFHFYGEMKVIYQIVPYDPLNTQFSAIDDWVLLEALVDGKLYDESFPKYIHHFNTLEYAERFLVPISEFPLPIEFTTEY